MQPEQLSAQEAMGHAVAWWMAVRQQRQRVLPSEPTLSLAGSRQVDAYLFVIALHHFRTAVALVRQVADPAAWSSIDDALSKFDGDAPQVRDLRNVISHYEDYALGKGHLQRDAPGAWLQIFYSAGDDYHLYVKHSPGKLPLKIGVAEATGAADQLFRGIGRALDTAEAPS